MDGQSDGFATSTGDRTRTLAEDYRRLGALQAVRVIVQWEDGSRIERDAWMRYSKNYKRPDDAKRKEYVQSDAYAECDIRWREDL